MKLALGEQATMQKITTSSGEADKTLLIILIELLSSTSMLSVQNGP